MPIEFSCPQCRKPLFAQAHYSGATTTCPGCREKILIPTPPPEPPKLDVTLVEMDQPPQTFSVAIETATVSVPPQETGDEFSPVTRLTGSDAPATISAETLQNAYTSTPEPVAPAPTEATQRCPFCAETIKAAAIKCRFCGSFLDERTPATQHEQHQRQIVAAMLVLAERSTLLWRMLSTLVTTGTAGWLTLLSLESLLGPDPNYLAIGFNASLILGLVWSSRQMRQGHYQVFLAAALAVVLCMPINSLLGIPEVSAQQLEELHKSNPTLSLTDDQLQQGISGFFTLVGLALSIPVWIATAKVAAVQRLQNLLRKKV